MKIVTIDGKYRNLGGEHGFLGKPTSNEEICSDLVGHYRHFKNGSIHWHPGIGAFETHGAIQVKWGELGWENGFLGYPISDESDFLMSFIWFGVEGQPSQGFSESFDRLGGRVSWFQGGCILWWKPEMSYSDIAKTEKEKWGETTILLRPSKEEKLWVPVITAKRSLWSRIKEPTINHVKAIHLEDISSSYGRNLELTNNISGERNEVKF